MSYSTVHYNEISAGRQLVLEAYNKDRKATQKAVQEFNSAMENYIKESHQKESRGSYAHTQKFIKLEHDELYKFGKKIAEILGLVYTNNPVEPSLPISKKREAIFDYVARNRDIDGDRSRKGIEVHPHVKKIMQRILDSTMIDRDTAKKVKAVNIEKAQEKTQREKEEEARLKGKEVYWRVGYTGTLHGTLIYNPIEMLKSRDAI